MISILGAGRASAVAGTLLLALAGSSATAQMVAPGSVQPYIQPLVQPVVAAVQQAVAPDLDQLVASNSGEDALDDQAQCLATAVYFESRGEPLQGQLAVANVVINRARSGRFPADWCGVVKQRAQFSFVRNGAFPWIDPACEAWRRARAIARIAQKNLAVELPADVLWYHANYVAPRWRNQLVKVEQIGAHIFYRA
ncbi:cell wall hydrolase [Sphingomonas sp. ASV193]|uniref:cell wall hydrolase n=1 Tax=Sphingomonas sp. ASV193 TaxID=3144405 RepID=UPI0032E8960F